MAMMGKVIGISQAISSARLTMPIAVADLLMLRIMYGNFHGTAIVMALSPKTLQIPPAVMPSAINGMTK